MQNTQPLYKARNAKIRLKSLFNNALSVYKGDIQEILSGKVPKSKGGVYVVDGRTYGVHNGAIYPIDAPGYLVLTKQEATALRKLIMEGPEKGLDELRRGTIPAQDIQKAFKIYIQYFN